MILNMEVIQGKYAVCKLKANAKIPSFLLEEEFVSITRTSDELSIVCNESVLGDYLDDFGKAEVFPNWKCLKVLGPLDFSLVGILAKITNIISEIDVSVFAISTFDTDYIFINNEQLDHVVNVLRGNNIVVNV